MALKSASFALIVIALASMARAEIIIDGAYVRSASPMAKSGAAFMVLHNSGDTDDRLISARTDIAARTELHTHKDLGNGVMQMLPVEGGLVIPAQGEHRLERGGDHVMLMGISAPLQDGTSVTITLQFEQAGEMTVEIPVDQIR